MAGVSTEITESPPIHPHSPMGVIAGITLVLRERFETAQGLPWKWTEDPNTSSILILPAFDEDTSETTNFTPRMIVERGPAGFQKVAIGDMGQHQPELLQRGGKYVYQKGEFSVGISVYGATYAETEFLADLVQNTITANQDIIERTFYIHNMTPVMLQPVRQVQEDAQEYLCEIQFRVTVERRWFTMPVGQPLRKYRADLNSLLESTKLIIRSVTEDA